MVTGKGGLTKPPLCMGLTYIKTGKTTVYSLQFKRWYELVQITTIENQAEQSPTLSQYQKFHKSIKVAKEIGSLAYDVGTTEFRRQYGVIPCQIKTKKPDPFRFK